MANKRSEINVSLNFDADVSKARKEMESLQASLDKIMNMRAHSAGGDTLGYLSQDIEKASLAAATLRTYLADAFNVRTGKLDLIKFNQSLTKSGLTAESLKATLSSVGPAGQRAFFELSQAVASSEMPIIRISDRMRKLGITLANTAKWQFSSTALHAFVGSISSAYNYAKDLNESLNNIRIVTGQTTEQMSKFAVQANNAAKALSASTLAYTDAALIFYQQGLNDEEVAARAEATVKLSNITGQGAKEVSDQLTAIWNNFAEGSQNLEYYADVITALGAATASSSAEISQGLSKFAAVADTVGLSYEKATAALATVIATTRQSADIVGTSFRTIFARLENLSLGETLEDGVNLTKYSEALAKVGVNILNQQGELKTMDSILNELGERWKTLNEAQQVGLAQTVAGVRQYSQFLALMNNYDYLLENENIALTSEGTVQKQADIYAESWEAASKRVKASLEGLYTSLLDDKFFIKINDGFADIINYTKSFTDSLGGLKGLLTIIGSLLLSTFSNQIADRLSMFGSSIMAMTSGGRARLETRRNEFTQAAVNSYREEGSYIGESQAISAEASIKNARLFEEFNKKATEEQRQIAELQKQRADKAAEEAIAQGDITKNLEKQADALLRSSQLRQSGAFSEVDDLKRNNYFMDAIRNNDITDLDQRGSYLRATRSGLGIFNSLQSGSSYIDEDIIKRIRDQALSDTKNLSYQSSIMSRISSGYTSGSDLGSDAASIQTNINLINAYEKALQKVRGTSKDLTNDQRNAFNNLANATKNNVKAYEAQEKALEKLNDQQRQQVLNANKGDKSGWANESAENKIAMDAAKEAVDQYRESIEWTGQALTNFDDQIERTNINLDNARNTATSLGGAGEEVANSAEQAGNAFADLAERTENATNANQNYEQSLQNISNSNITVSQAIINMSSALMQFAMAANAIKTIGNIWSDENLSTGEKLLQTLTSLSMVLPAVSLLFDQQRLAKLGDSAATLLHMQAVNADTAAEGASIPVKYASGAAGWAALGPISIFIAIAAAAIALIYGIVKALDSLINAQSAEAKAAEEANKALEEAKENATATKNAYQELKNEITDYSEAVNALDQYTKGTEEWRDASEELNEQIQNLITKYPDLLKIGNIFNSDGTLNEDVLNQYLQQKETAAIGSSIAIIGAQKNKNTADYDLQKSEYINQIRSVLKQTSVGLQLGETQSQSSGVTLADWAPEIVEAQLKGTLNKDVLKEIANEIFAQNSDIINMSNNETWTSILNNIDTLSNSFDNLIKSGNDLTTSFINSNQQLLGVYGDKFSEDPIQRLAQLDTYNQALFEKTNSLENLLSSEFNKGNVSTAGANDNVNYALGTIGKSTELFNFYQDWLIATGKTVNETTKEWKLASDAIANSNSFVYYTGSDNETATIEFSKMVADVATYRVAQEIDKILENSNSEFANNLINNPNGVALANFITNGNFNGVTVSDIQNLQGQNRQNLIDLFGDEEQLKETLANFYGVENIDDQTLERIFANFEQGTQGNIIGEALSNYTNYIQKNLVDSLKGSFKLEDLKPIADMYTKALAQGGISGIEALNRIAEKAGSESGPLMSVVASLDLTAMSAEEINKALFNAGIAFKLTETDITQIINLLTESSKKTIEAAQETYQEVSKIVSKLKDEGDIIDADQYKALMQLNPALKSYFTMMADGTYMLTGAAEDFRTAVQSSQIAQLSQARENQVNTALAYGNLNAESGQSFLNDYQYLKASSDPTRMISRGTIDSMVSALQDSGTDVTKWQAALNDPNNSFLDTAKQVAEKYQEIFSDADIFETKAREASAKIAEIDAAIAFTRYQNDVSNAGLDYEETERYAKILQEVNAEGEITLDQARQLAIANQRLDRGLKELNDNYEDWSESLKNTGENTLEYASTIGEARDALADLLNISSGDKLSTKWIDKLLKDSEKMQKVLAGDAEAIQDLRKEALGELIDNSEFESGFQGLKEAIKEMAEIDPNEAWLQNLNTGLQEATFTAEGLKSELLNLGDGAELSEDYTNALNAMLATGRMTEQTLNDIFASIGYKPKVTTESVQQDTEIPVYTTYESYGSTGNQTIYDMNGNEQTIPVYTKTTWTEQTGKKVMTQSVPIVQIQSDSEGKGKIDVVNAGASRITPSRGATSAGKGGKGGGGGGGGGSRSKKDLKNAEDEIERYHVIDKTIEVLSKKYDKLSAAKDAAFGLQRLKYIEQENKLLEKQYKAEKIRLEEVEQYYAKDRGAIEAYGAIIDDNGVITNYEELMRREMDKLNAAYTAYNNGELSDEIIEAKEKDYEKFKEILSQFEETNAEYFDQLKKVEDAIREQIAGRLELIQAKVEVDLELPDAELKEIEFKLKTLQDTAFTSAEKIVLWGNQAEIAAQKFRTYADAFKDILMMSVTDEAGNKIGGFGLTAEQADRLMNGDMNVFDEAGVTGENAKALMDALKEYWDNLITEYDAAYQARKNIEDELFNELNEYSDAIDKQISKMEKLVSIANNIKSIIGIMGRKNLGISTEVMDQINQNILTNIQGQVGILKAEQDALEISLNEAQGKLQDAIARNDQEAIQYWTNASQEIEANLLETKEKLLSQIEDYVKRAQEILAENIRENFAELARQTYGMTLDDAIASYDRYKTLSSDYLKDYQKIYELSKLTRMVQNSIDETPSLWIKERLRDLQEEINEYQAEGLQMTRYEVDYLNRKYELRMAELALEEAQNSKDMVRLSRNADGGWGYVYTANQDNIDQAQQNYEEKLYALQQLNYQAIEDSQSTILQLQQEFEEKMIEIMTNNELTEEERNAKVAELQEYYLARMQVYYDTLDSALEHNRELYTEDWQWYNELTGYRISADEDYIDKFEETWVAGQMQGIASVEEAFENYKNNLGSFDNNDSILGQCYKNLLDYKDRVNEVFEAAELDTSSFASTVGQIMATMASEIDKARESGENLATELGINLPKTIDNISSWQEKLNPKLEMIKDTINKISAAVQALISKLKELSSTNANVNVPASSGGTVIPNSPASEGAGGSGSGGGGSNNPGGGSSLGARILLNTRYERSNDRAHPDVHYVIKTYSSEPFEEKTVEKHSFVNGGAGQVCTKCGAMRARRWTGKEYVWDWVAYDTGGYTGDFGPEGKLAVLHEKELVLNKQDTANLLQMVNMARGILGGTELNMNLPNIRANRKFNSVKNDGIGTQEVHIEALFPNAVNHLEIEEAFQRLINYSSQNAFNFDLNQKINFF